MHSGWGFLFLTIIRQAFVSNNSTANTRRSKFRQAARNRPPVETIDVHVHEVNLVLSVTDHHGKFVNNLRPSDLRILDNGVEQTKLTFFERETDLPIKVALVIDISASVAYQLATECAAIQSFSQRGIESIGLRNVVRI